VLPADGVLVAASRWLTLLPVSSVREATAIIRSDSAYTDLSPTQYASALDWLRSLDLFSQQGTELNLSPAAKALGALQLTQLVFDRGLQQAKPLWLPDADTLVLGSGELPFDAERLASCLGLSGSAAMLAIRRIHGRIDLSERERVGSEGERAFVELVEGLWPGSTAHIALLHDGFGYDVALKRGSVEWHIELKSTTRKGRLLIYLSRREYEVAQVDPQWRLVVVGLDELGQLGAMATVRHEILLSRSPSDQSGGAIWQSARYQVGRGDLDPGLWFLSEADQADVPMGGPRCSSEHGAHFAWAP
jgi:hypothetical protein